jgi:hypothetical protein
VVMAPSQPKRAPPKRVASKVSSSAYLSVDSLRATFQRSESSDGGSVEKWEVVSSEHSSQGKSAPVWKDTKWVPMPPSSRDVRPSPGSEISPDATFQQQPSQQDVLAQPLISTSSQHNKSGKAVTRERVNSVSSESGRSDVSHRFAQVSQLTSKWASKTGASASSQNRINFKKKSLRKNSASRTPDPAPMALPAAVQMAAMKWSPLAPSGSYVASQGVVLSFENTETSTTVDVDTDGDERLDVYADRDVVDEFANKSPPFSPTSPSRSANNSFGAKSGVPSFRAQLQLQAVVPKHNTML